LAAIQSDTFAAHHKQKNDAPVPIIGPSCTINGIVRNLRDHVVPDAVIHFHAAGRVYQTQTGPDGTFHATLPTGIVHVISEHRGDGRSALMVDMSPNQVTYMDISLSRGHANYYYGHHHFHLGLPHVHVVRK
jgi:hypothetical protein